MLQEQSDQHTKNIALLTTEKLNITAITWNLYGSTPSSEALSTLLQTQQLADTDLIFFATQECERSLFASFCLEAKDCWQQQLSQTCTTHKLMAAQTMRGLHIAILVKKSLQSYFQLQRKNKLRAGNPCNTMGNKGAISVQFYLMGQQFQVINCHLAAKQGECQRRNQTIGRIMEQLVRKQQSCEVIMLGDFNYRIDMSNEEYQLKIENKGNTDVEQRYRDMVERDQLRNQQDLVNRYLKVFEEGPITFPPTYKLGTTDGQYKRQRIPGWTDRIFTRKGGKLTRNSYSCGYKIYSSDHRPVYATYSMPMDQHAQNYNSQHFIGVKGTKQCQLM